MIDIISVGNDLHRAAAYRHSSSIVSTSLPNKHNSDPFFYKPAPDSNCSTENISSFTPITRLFVAFPYTSSNFQTNANDHCSMVVLAQLCCQQPGR